MVLRSGALLTLVGIGLGAALGWPMMRVVRSVLIDVAVADPFAIVATGALMMGTAIVACWWPARDAGKIDPVALLRGE
jgi:putative ABC transport system permease protein